MTTPEYRIETDVLAGAALLPQHLHVIVTGGRFYADIPVAQQVLSFVHRQRVIASMMEGGATGADYIARKWSKTWVKSHQRINANWREHGKGAGMIRNRLMLKIQRPDLVIAFPGDTGTADMVSKARAARVPLLIVALDGEFHFEFPA